MDTGSALGMTNAVHDLVGNTDSFGTGDVRNYTPDGPPKVIQKRGGAIKLKSKRKRKQKK